MEPGASVAGVVATLAGTGLLVSLPTLLLTSLLDVPTRRRNICYLSASSVCICYATLLVAMLWGLYSDWSEPAKIWMFAGWMMTVPATVGAVALISAASPSTRAALRRYFILTGVLAMLLLAIPAIIFIVVALPGHA